LKRNTKKEGGFLKQIHYLVVEGCIGVGKTSFCNILAQKLNAKLVLENVEDNPFIQNFYKDKERFAFQAQIFFLLSRYRQQAEIAQKDMFYNLVVSDYVFAKDRIFAGLNLNDNELALYDRVADALEPAVPKPDYIIYLQATTDRLLSNIRQRGRKYESPISQDYLNTLNEAYNHFFINYSDVPVLIVDASDIDFVHRSDDLDEILRELDRGGKGTRFIKPLPRKES